GAYVKFRQFRQRCQIAQAQARDFCAPQIQDLQLLKIGQLLQIVVLDIRLAQIEDAQGRTLGNLLPAILAEDRVAQVERVQLVQEGQDGQPFFGDACGSEVQALQLRRAGKTLQAVIG